MHNLSLKGCHKIADASAIGGVHSLDLTGCTSIVDVSALGYFIQLNCGGSFPRQYP